MDLEKLVDQVVNTDVLIIGSGIAGAFAALKARAAGVEVLVADRAVSGRSGASSVASGVFHHFHPAEDDIEDALKEGILNKVYLTDQKISRKALFDTYRCLEEMMAWGVKFEKRGDKLVRVKGHGNVACRIAVLSGSGGQMMSALASRMRQAGIRVIDRLMMTDLLTSDGKLPTRGQVVGAIGFSTQNGHVFVIKSKTTILCAGSWKLPYAEHAPAYQGGDGHAMALRAGAEMNGLDAKVRGVRPIYATVGSTINIIMGQGAIMTNNLGERYMERLDPLRKEQTERWLLTAGTIREIQEGRGPIGLDMTHFTPEQVRLVRAAVPLVVAKIEAAGKDITRDKLEYTAWRYPILQVGRGGARVNDRGETSVPGLYAAGDNSDNARASIMALPGGAVIGSWAGENAGRHASKAAEPKVVDEQVNELKAAVLTPLKVGDGIPYKEVWERAEMIARDGIGLLKHDERLKKAMVEIQRTRRDDIPRVRARDPQEAAKVHTLANFLEVAEPVCAASMHRKETRELALREDFPETDNTGWLKYTITTKTQDGMTMEDVPIPADSYSYPPPRERFNQLHLFREVATERDILDKAVGLR